MRMYLLSLLSAIQCATAGPTRHCEAPAGEVGAAFALTNAPFNNEVVAFSRSSSGELTQVATYPTGGAGECKRLKILDIHTDNAFQH